MTGAQETRLRRGRGLGPADQRSRGTRSSHSWGEGGPQILRVTRGLRRRPQSLGLSPESAAPGWRRVEAGLGWRAPGLSPPSLPAAAGPGVRQRVPLFAGSGRTQSLGAPGSLGRGPVSVQPAGAHAGSREVSFLSGAEAALPSGARWRGLSCPRSCVSGPPGAQPPSLGGDAPPPAPPGPAQEGMPSGSQRQRRRPLLPVPNTVLAGCGAPILTSARTPKAWLPHPHSCGSQVVVAVLNGRRGPLSPQSPAEL